MGNVFCTLLLRSITTFLFCVLANSTFSQQFATQTPKYVSMCSNTNAYYESLPPGYDPNGSQTYPLILFIQGVGEMGIGSPSTLPMVLWHGIPKLINQGTFPAYFTVNGQTHSFIIISPQFINWPTSTDIDQILNYLVQNYKVNTSKIYLTGFSMGGGVTWDYAGGSPSYANRLAAIVPICGASYPSTQKCRTIAEANVAVWATNNDGDPVTPASYTLGYVNGINEPPAPTPAAKASIFANAPHHDAWSRTYDPNYTENGLNIYQWMLQFSRGSSGPQNQPPTANAGADQNLSSTATSTTLNGSATDADGTIASYNWSKIFGPAQFNIHSPNTAQTNISNLVPGMYTFRLRVTDNLGAIAIDDINVTIPYSIPGRVEAENWSAMSGVQTEFTQDAGGGQNVGWIDQNDWMDYYVNVPATGQYTMRFRIATPNPNAVIQIRKSDGTVLNTVNLTNTWGWQTWQTVTTTVALTQGAQTIRIFSAGGGWNFNWMEFAQNAITNQPPNVNAGADQTITLPANSVTLNATANDPDGSITSYQWIKVSGPAGGTFNNSQVLSPVVSNLSQGLYVFRLTVTDNVGASASDEVTVTVNAAAPPPPPPSSTTTKIEAENYSAMSGIQTEYTLDEGGGLNVGWIDNGDWMDYVYNAPSAGTYAVKLRIATPGNGAQLQIRKTDGTILSTVNIPNTSAFQIWQTVTTSINLSAGQQTLRIVSSASAFWNINWIELSTTASAPLPITSNKIEAENYTSMSGIQTEGTHDEGGGLNVGWIDQNDWMDYAYNAPSTGTYTVKLRIATPNNGAQLQIRKSDGTVLSTVSIPNTGAYQIWQTVTTTVNLTAGQQTLRIISSAAPFWNINWLEISSTGSAPPPPPPTVPTTTKIEAENWSAMHGVLTETAWGDPLGGNLNVGWIEQGDWMDYSINVAASGTYTLKLRIATPNINAQLQVRSANGTVLTTVTLPNTWGYQSWQTVTTSVNLQQGTQTIRLISVNSDGWNINWLELSGPVSTSTNTGRSIETTEAEITYEEPKIAATLYPNPARDRLMVNINGEETGNVLIRITNAGGAVVREMIVQKPNKGMWQTPVNISSLTAGVYFVSIQSKTKKETIRLLKQ